MIQLPLPTFVINMKTRPERREHVIREFNNKIEFDINIVDAIEDDFGAVGLWKTIKHIVQNLVDKQSECILICEDDHQFTEHYSWETLVQSIQTARVYKADIVLGGVSKTQSLISVTHSLIWVEWFYGTQFTILFNTIFDKVISADFQNNDSADLKYSQLTNNKFCLYPFISIQKEFGYSDATPTRHESTGNVERFFTSSASEIRVLLEGEKYYKSMQKKTQLPEHVNNIAISTFIITTKPCEEISDNINSKFFNKPEFSIQVCESENTEYSKWNTVRKIIQQAIYDDEDIIAICEDTICFSNFYTKSLLLTNIFESYNQGCDMLLSSTSNDFYYAIECAENRFWVNGFRNSGLIIIYRKIFKNILDTKHYDNIGYQNLLSSITNSKMVFFPFLTDNSPSEKEEDSTDISSQRLAILNKYNQRFVTLLS